VLLAEVIREVTAELKPSLNNRGHSLTLNIEPNLPPAAADRDRIAQVIINLLGNAIKYTPDGGKITIQARRVDNTIQVSISDTGIGIKPEDLPKLFKRFSTVGDVTKHKSGKTEFMAGGTGLGLSIIKGIIKAHGGEVWVNSQYGQGSTFHVSLPLAGDTNKTGNSAPIYRASQIAQPISAGISKVGQLKILIIDDEADILDLARRMLASEYTIITAQTGATGLKEAIARQPDLILLDVMMPGISGYDVCRTLKRNPKTKATPVLIFTAATEQVNEDKARDAGADGFVTKPFKKECLVNLIESYRNKVNETNQNFSS